MIFFYSSVIVIVFHIPRIPSLRHIYFPLRQEIFESVYRFDPTINQPAARTPPFPFLLKETFRSAAAVARRSSLKSRFNNHLSVIGPA